MHETTDLPKREWALITGASAGIGEELARVFAAEGTSLVLAARRAERLNALAEDLSNRHGISLLPLVVDLATPDGPAKIAEELSSRSLAIDYLVNNAGFGTRSAFVETSLSSQLEMVQVNLTSLVHLTHLILPEMLHRGSGRVLNVASTAAFQPGPRMAVYYATKAFVVSFSEALYEECHPSGVTVTCLCPGPTRTEFAEVAKMHDALLFRMRPMAAAAVARIGYRGMKQGRPLVVAGVGNRLLAFSVPFVPRALVRQIVKRLQ